jgi:hypothetical protein
MRYAIFGAALILGLELLGMSIAGAMPASGNTIVKTYPSGDVIQVGDGCGLKRWRDPKTGKCPPG